MRAILLSIFFAVAAFALGLQWSANFPRGGAPVLTEVAIASPHGLRPSAQDKALLELMAAGRQTNGSAVYNHVIFNFYSSIWKEYGKGAQSPVILELGPGAKLEDLAVVSALIVAEKP